MDRSYAKPLDVPALARIALTSEAHFIRTFKQTFGETPHRYLQRRRLERAMALLRETDRPVTDICLDVGFTSLGTFSRTFKRILGMSPSSYRDAWRAGTCTADMVRPASSWLGRGRRAIATRTAVSEKRGRRRTRSVSAMLKALTHTFIYVLDQDEALGFYVGKLGLEVSTDADLGFMRWLTLTVPGRPRASSSSPRRRWATTRRRQRRSGALVTKGGGSGIIFSVEDCRRTYEEFVAKGVEFTQEPTEHFYGIDCGLRDPFGNPVRLTQRASGPIEIPSSGELKDAARARGCRKAAAQVTRI